MTFLDRILILIGTNPDAYQLQQDKWRVVRVYLFDTAPYVLPWILGALPLLWLGWRRYKRKPITPKHVVWAGVLVVALALLGYFGPTLLLGLMAWISFGGGIDIYL